MSDGVTVRAATTADAEAVSAVANAAYRVGGGQAWTTEAHLVGGPRITVEEVRELVAREGSVVLVAEREGRVVGCVHVERKDAATSHLGLLSVDPEVQAGGVGRRLVEAGEAWARERFGARRMVMHVVSVREELLRWYERRGYRRTGERVAFREEGRVRFLRGELEFERLEKGL